MWMLCETEQLSRNNNLDKAQEKTAAEESDINK